MSPRGRGELEAAVLRALRAANRPFSATEVRATFDPADGVPALTTVLTALDRLVTKGEVQRHARSPRRQLFTAKRTAADEVSSSMLGALAAVEDRRAALLKFTGNLSAQDAAYLREALGRRPEP